MATQDASSIPFTSSQPRQALKLLELPPELLELLESENPPTLTLTSTSPTAPALLQTPTRSYRIAQKNSSNPLMLLTPSSSSALSADSLPSNAEDVPEIPIPSVTTIATIEDTLELTLVEEVVAKEGGAKEKVEKKPTKVNKWHEKFAKGRNK